MLRQIDEWLTSVSGMKDIPQVDVGLVGFAKGRGWDVEKKRDWVGGYGPPVGGPGLQGAKAVTRFALVPQASRRSLGLVQATKKTSGVTRFIGYEAARTAFRWGTAVGSVVLGYKYLVDSGLIERGAEQFGTGYGGALPRAYYSAQEEVLPKLKELETETYAAQAPVYMEVERQKIWDEAYQRALAYQAMQPYYQDTQETVKANQKMPYRPRIE